LTFKDTKIHMKAYLDEWIPKAVEKMNGKWNKGFATWMSDQSHGTERIKSMPWYPKGVKFIEREGLPPATRIDRSNWPETVRTGAMVDAHILRAPEDPGNWERLRPIVEQLLPRHVPMMGEYRAKYLEAK
jgi:hypothetical protein